MKNNNRIIIAVYALLCATALLQSSCNKKPKGTFTIKGKLMDSCGGNPSSNVNLVVWHFKGGASFNIKLRDSIGYGKSDVDGNFEIICQNWDEGRITLYTPGVFSEHVFVEDYYVNDVEGNTIDFSTIYEYTKFVGTANINITGSYTAIDTLYIANKPYYPVPVGSILKEYFSRSNSNPAFSDKPNIDSMGVYWAIGKAAYDAAVASASSMQRFTVKQSLCNMPEQITNVTIGK